MGEFVGVEQASAKTRDPLLRFLGGCAIVAAVVVVLVLGIAGYVGWNLTRDPSPGRPQETFLTGDETRYWRVELKPDDAGLLKLFERIEALGNETRRKALHGTFLETLPIPRRRARLEQLAPLTLEGALYMSDPAEGPQTPLGWAARGTFSHDVLRLRAGLRVMRWAISRDAGKAETIDVLGLPVTTVHDDHVAFALANTGNRVLAANEASRIRAMLEAGQRPRDPASVAMHDGVRLDDEDAWAFLSAAELGGVARPLSISAAAASFDVNDGDELRFRVAVSERAAVPEGTAFSGSREDCLEVVSSLLPMFERDEIAIDGDGASPSASGLRVFTGRIAELSSRLPDVPKRLGERMLRATVGAPETPSASPSPPSPPSPAGPRSGTPGAPPRGESPTPPR